jgi:O-antigen/teichoic acid export membrane protein
MYFTKAVRGTVYLTIQQLIQYSAAFVFYLGVARFVSQTEVGLWSILVASTAVFTTITLIGLPIATQKFVSENYGRGDISTAASVSRLSFAVVTLSTLPTFGAVFLLSPSMSTIVLGGPQYAVPFVLMFSASSMLNFTALYGADMLGLGMYLQVAVQNIVFIIISRILGSALAYMGYGLLGLSSGWAVGALCCLTISIYLMRNRFPKPAGNLFPKELRVKVLRYSSPVWILAIITLAQSWADIAILYALTGQPRITGVYYLASAGATLLAIFWVAVSIVMLSLMSSEEARAGKEVLPDIYKTASRLLNMLILPIGAGLAAIAPTAVEVAYGRSYLQGSGPFALLTATAILPAYVSMNSSALQAIGETKALAKIGATSAIVDILLVTVLVRPLGVDGAALARIAMFLVAFVLTQRTLAWTAQIKIDLEHLARTALLAATTAVPLGVLDYIVSNQISPIVRLLLEGIFFLILYMVSLRLFRVLTRGDIELLRTALPSGGQRILGLLQRLESKPTERKC